MSRALTVSDGQLGTTAATLLSGVSMPTDGRRLDIVIQNTGPNSEVVLITFQRAGGTARRLARAVLEENEQLIINSLPVQGDDTPLGRTTTASVVDFMTMISAGGPFRIEVLSANGTGKGVAALRQILQGMEVLAGETADPG